MGRYLQHFERFRILNISIYAPCVGRNLSIRWSTNIMCHSIYAPHVGRDVAKQIGTFTVTPFQSMYPVWGTKSDSVRSTGSSGISNLCALSQGTINNDIQLVDPDNHFNICTPMGRHFVIVRFSNRIISIYAPKWGATRTNCRMAVRSYFNLCAPCEALHMVMGNNKAWLRFQCMRPV